MVTYCVVSNLSRTPLPGSILVLRRTQAVTVRPD